jgi:hypothetical protein
MNKPRQGKTPMTKNKKVLDELDNGGVLLPWAGFCQGYAGKILGDFLEFTH